jgi:hypothetical protein
MILTNGEIVTLDPARPRVAALAIRQGRIAALGPSQEVEALRTPETRVVDLGGKVVLPSLKDHHLHVNAVGFAVMNRASQQALRLELTDAASEQEVADRVRRRAARLPPGTWIFGAAWNQIRFGTQALPTHHALTAAAPEHPVFLVRVDAHSAWVNAAALRVAGITRTTPEPYGGQIRRLPGGEPSGILIERAVEAVMEKYAQPSDAELTESFRAGAAAIAAQGITDVYDAAFLPFPGIVAMNLPLERFFDALCRLDAAEPLPVRVNLMVPAALAGAVLRGQVSREISPRLRVTHIKLFCDGAFGSRGAALSRPYDDDPAQRGCYRMTRAEMDDWIARALDAGFGVATHAIGDEAVTRTLDAYEAALAARPDINPRRLRIEHISDAAPRDLERAARLGVLVCIQPGFVWPEADGLIMEDWRLGPANSMNTYAFATLERLGAHLAGSSDDYLAPQHPLWNFYAAITRKNPEGIPRHGWHPQEKLSRASALRLFTEFHLPGGDVRPAALAPGAPADLVVLSANPLTAEESSILKTRVHATLLEGRVTHTDGTI